MVVDAWKLVVDAWKLVVGQSVTWKLVVDAWKLVKLGVLWLSHAIDSTFVFHIHPFTFRVSAATLENFLRSCNPTSPHKNATTQEAACRHDFHGDSSNACCCPGRAGRQPGASAWADALHARRWQLPLPLAVLWAQQDPEVQRADGSTAALAPGALGCRAPYRGGRWPSVEDVDPLGFK